MTHSSNPFVAGSMIRHPHLFVGGALVGLDPVQVELLDPLLFAQTLDVSGDQVGLHDPQLIEEVEQFGVFELSVGRHEHGREDDEEQSLFARIGLGNVEIGLMVVGEVVQEEQFVAFFDLLQANPEHTFQLTGHLIQHSLLEIH